MTISSLLRTYYQYCENPRGQINEEKPARMTHDMEMGLDVFSRFYYFSFSHLSQEYNSSVKCFPEGQFFCSFDQWQSFFNYL